MENFDKEKLKALLDASKPKSEMSEVLESIEPDIKKTEKEEILIMLKDIDEDQNLTDEQKEELKRKLNVEAIKMDIKF